MYNTGFRYGVGEQNSSEESGSVFLYNQALKERKSQSEKESQAFQLLNEVYAHIDSELVYDILVANKGDIIKAAEILDDLNQW